MKFRLVLLCAIGVSVMAADLPYVGKWKLNLAKNDFGQTTVTIESLPGEEWQTSAMGISYKFRMDGADYPDGMGGTVAWKAVGGNTWESVSKVNGTVTETDTFTLSPDGKTLTQASKAMKADGGSIDSTTVFARASGGKALAGKWKTRKVSGGSGSMEFVASEGGGLIFKDPDAGVSCDARLDGHDYPCAGPMTPPGFTVAMTNAARALEIVIKKDGKPFFQANYRVSADGKSMTETGVASSGGDRFKMVFDRM